MSTIGYTSDPGTEEGSWQNFMLVARFNAPGSGDANTGTFYAYMKYSGGTPENARCGVYADDGSGEADSQALLSDTASVPNDNTAKTLQSATITWTGIVASTDYHLVVNHGGVGSTHYLYYDSGTGDSDYAANDPDATLPATCPALTTNSDSRDYGMYVDYTASGGAATPHGVFGIALHGPFGGPV